MNKALFAILILLVGSSSFPAQTEKYPFQRGDGDLISGLSWSPRNDLILTASGDENGLRLWDVAAGKLLWKSDLGFLRDDLELYSIRHSHWTNDQRLIVTGTDNGSHQHGIDGPQQRSTRELAGIEGPVRTVRIEGRQLLAVTYRQWGVMVYTTIYDDKGRLLENAEYLPGGNPDTKSTSAYDERGNEIGAPECRYWDRTIDIGRSSDKRYRTPGLGFGCPHIFPTLAKSFGRLLADSA